MSYSVKFDSVEIIDTTNYKTSSVKHHSAPSRNINLLDLGRDNGAIIVNEKYGTKTISIQGVLQGSSASDLQTKLDTFKELFSRPEKNLDITPDGGSIRRYVATCTRHDLPENHYNILFLPFTADFVVPSGMGEDTTSTAIINAQAVSVDVYTSSMVLAGSAKPKPVIDITFGSTNTNSRGIAFENTDNGQTIVITKTTAFSNNNHLIINTQEKTVQYDDENIRFYGPFPDFIIGTNNFKVYSGDIVQQEYLDGSGSINAEFVKIYGNNYIAQSFSVPYTDDTFRSIGLYINAVGSDLGTNFDLYIDIVDDDGNAPNLASNVADFPVYNVAQPYNVLDPISDNLNFTLTSGKKYWMVFSAGAGGNINNCIRTVCRIAKNTYKLGNYSDSADAGSTWNNDGSKAIFFKLYYGGIADASPAYTLDVDQFKSYL